MALLGVEELVDVGRLCRKVRFLGQNPKIVYQEFNELQTPQLSKKQLCDRTDRLLAATDANGIVAELYRYTVYAEPGIFDTSGAARSSSALGNRLLLSGQPFFPELDMHRLEQRWYRPSLGRFLRPDPLGLLDGPNVFNYAGANPVMYVDPLGLDGRENAIDSINAAIAELEALRATLPNRIASFGSDLGLLSTEEFFRRDALVALYESEIPNRIDTLIRTRNSLDPNPASRAMTDLWQHNSNMIEELLKIQILIARAAGAPVSTIAGLAAEEGASAAGVEDPVLRALIGVAAGEAASMAVRGVIAGVTAGMTRSGQGALSLVDGTERALAATEASVTDKLARYLLNPSHSIGASKAKWFHEALGFTQANASGLAKQIVFDPNKAVQTAVTEYGTKFNQVISITGANGRVIDVTFAWIRNSDGIVRLVTGIPTKP